MVRGHPSIISTSTPQCKLKSWVDQSISADVTTEATELCKSSAFFVVSLSLLQALSQIQEEQIASSLVPHSLCTRQGPGLCLLVVNFPFFHSFQC